MTNYVLFNHASSRIDLPLKIGKVTFKCANIISVLYCITIDNKWPLNIYLLHKAF